MKYRRIMLPTLVGFIAFLSSGWLLQRGSSEHASVYQKARRFEDVLAHVASYYVDSLDERQLYDLAIDGMLQQLGDPYTTFLRAEDFENLSVNTTGNYGGLGIRIEVSGGWVTVVTPLADTPAERAGIQAGDRIVEVEGNSTQGWSLERAASVLRGEPGSKAMIRVLRPGLSEPLVFTIARARIHVTSVRHAGMVAPQIGYVRLETVSEESANEVAEAVKGLRAEGARALIFDLRFNPGGVLHQGVAVSDLFLDSGDEVVSTRGRAPNSTRAFNARARQRWAEMPVVVLVNGFSASAAEIIAGALQDHDRALIVGTPTFGKGLVQTVFQFGRDEALKLTTGRWFTPSGRSIDRARTVTGELDIAATHGDSGTTSDIAFRTEGGRVVTGGGGIHPDILAADTLTPAELAFAEALGSEVQAFRDVMAAYATELTSAGTITDPNFETGASARSELLRRLRAEGVEMPLEIWDGASEYIGNEFEFQVLRYVFGRSAEMDRRTADDAVVRLAAELLEEAQSPADLFALAGQGREPVMPN